MNTFANTDAARDFLNSGSDRQTDPEVMNAIVAFSNDGKEAEFIWSDGLGNFDKDSLSAFVAVATKNHLLETGDLWWGALTLDQVIASNPNS